MLPNSFQLRHDCDVEGCFKPSRPMDSYSEQERRKFERKITSVELKVQLAGRTAPLRVSTTDLSVGGCYILTVYPLPIGARVEITIPMGVEKLSVRGIVKTCHHTVGNGVQFLGMAPADRVKLESFLSGEPFLETESKECATKSATSHRTLFGWVLRAGRPAKRNGRNHENSNRLTSIHSLTSQERNGRRMNLPQCGDLRSSTLLRMFKVFEG